LVSGIRDGCGGGGIVGVGGCGDVGGGIGGGGVITQLSLAEI